MIHYKIYIDKYNWSIEVFIVLSEVDIDAILRSIEKAEGSKKTLQMSYDSLTQGYNTGFTYSNMELLKSVLVINRSSSMEEFINTYNHEKNHVEMHICEKLGIDPYSEEAAYLSGDLALMLFLPAVCSFLV